MKKKVYNSCTVQRTFKRTHGTVDITTSEYKEGTSEIVTEPCNAPLFEDLAKEAGICRACASGWEHPENRFATKAEKTRALARR